MSILKFKTFNERVNITKPSKTSKKVFADDKLLKDISFSEATNNIAFYYEEKGNFFIPKGKFYVYFFDSHDNAKKLATGEIDFIFFPFKRRFDFSSAPITDIWKKSFLKDKKGSEHILGMIEGQVYEEDKLVEIQMMSVRPNFKFNKINYFLSTEVVEYAKNRFPDYKVAIEDPTEDGLEFAAKFSAHYPELVIFLTYKNRPKNWEKLKSVFKDVRTSVKEE